MLAWASGPWRQGEDGGPQSAPGRAVGTAWASLRRSRLELLVPWSPGEWTWAHTHDGAPLSQKRLQMEWGFWASRSRVLQSDAQETWDLKTWFVCKPGEVQSWTYRTIFSLLPVSSGDLLKVTESSGLRTQIRALPQHADNWRAAFNKTVFGEIVINTMDLTFTLTLQNMLRPWKIKTEELPQIGDMATKCNVGSWPEDIRGTIGGDIWI